ncbi:hypothetical protein CVT25_015002, partial [Psilocybe cyanescens]
FLLVKQSAHDPIFKVRRLYNNFLTRQATVYVHTGLYSQSCDLGAAVFLSIATNIYELIVWKAFSPTTVNIGRGSEFELRKRARCPLPSALHVAQQRLGAPGGVLEGAAPECDAADLDGGHYCGIKILGKSNRFRGQRWTYPSKLHSMPTSNVFIVSQMLSTRFPWNFEILAHSATARNRRDRILHVATANTLKEAVLHPIHTAINIALMLSVCALFSETWIEISGSGEAVMASYREGTMYVELKQVVPMAAALGGTIPGLLSVAADLSGVIGSGTGILMAVTIIYRCEFFLFCSRLCFHLFSLLWREREASQMRTRQLGCCMTKRKGLSHPGSDSTPSLLLLYASAVRRSQ